jgi:hypothetical protein
LVLRHIHSPSPEGHSFDFEPDTLLLTHVALEADLAPAPQHSLPRQALTGLPEHLHDLPVMERVPGRRGHLAVGGHLAARDVAYHFADRGAGILRGRNPEQAPRNFASGRSTCHYGLF